MKIGIYGQFYHPNAAEYIGQLLEILDQKNIEVHIEEDFLGLIQENKTITKDYPRFKAFEELDNSFELFFCIGGDGTILKSINYIRNLDIPIVGINTGRLGFLATIQKEQISETIDEILNKNFTLSPRSVLSIATNPESEDEIFSNIALNEIAVSRKNTTSMITVETWLDDQFLTSYWADGLIIATPTGSTGYSLSCGGPIIMPGCDNFVITPIAPHNLNVRPFVIPNKYKIKLKVESRERQFLVSLDSRIYSVENGSELEVEIGKFAIKMIKTHVQNFPETLRNKLLWGLDKRN